MNETREKEYFKRLYIMEQGMKDAGINKNTERTLREVFKPAELSITYRNQLLQDLITEASDIMKDSKNSLGKKPELWVAVAVDAVIAVIGYGIWLPYSLWDKLTS